MNNAQRILRVVPFLILAGLLIDQYAGRWGQPLVVAATLAVFLWIFRANNTATRITMLLCLTYATIGEVLLSLVWKVYEYRLDNLPLFVPPGHVLLFLLGVVLASHVNTKAVVIIGVSAATIVAWLAYTGRDTLSAVLVTVFLLSLVFGRHRNLYATMFVLALAMELYGTWLGNWHWHAAVGDTGLVTLNPPVAAGAFYCALDLLVMWSRRAAERNESMELQL